MSGNAFDYDLLVIGSGPAGQRAAIQGAKLNKKVAIVERRTVLGGCSVNLGTIPSKTLREAALELCGYRSREFYGASYTVKQHITMQDLLFRSDGMLRWPQLPSPRLRRCRYLPHGHGKKDRHRRRGGNHPRPEYPV